MNRTQSMSTMEIFSTGGWSKAYMKISDLPKDKISRLRRVQKYFGLLMPRNWVYRLTRREA